MQFYIINQQNWRKKIRCYIDPEISDQSLYGTINQNVYVWNLFIPKDRALALKNEKKLSLTLGTPIVGHPV